FPCRVNRHRGDTAKLPSFRHCVSRLFSEANVDAVLEQSAFVRIPARLGAPHYRRRHQEQACPRKPEDRVKTGKKKPKPKSKVKLEFFWRSFVTPSPFTCKSHEPRWWRRRKMISMLL